MKFRKLAVTLGASLLLLVGARVVGQRMSAQSAAVQTELAVSALAPDASADAPDVEYSSRSALERQLDELERELRAGGPAIPSPAGVARTRG